MSGKAGSYILWTVPREWHTSKVWAELKGVFKFGTFARITLVSLGIALAIRYYAEKALGPLDFNWTKAISISLVAGIAAMPVGAAECLIPPKVRVLPKGIHIIKGRTSFLASFSDIVAISIEHSVPPILTFQKLNRRYEYAIAESVGLDRLRQELERFSGRSVRIEQKRCAVNGLDPLPNNH